MASEVDVTPPVEVVVVTPDVVVVAPVVVVVADVVVVVGELVVVVVVPPDTAITGDMDGTDGVEVVTPDGVMVSLGYAVHVRLRGLPATMSVRLMPESSSMVTPPPLEVNGPSEAAGVGTWRTTPLEGIGLGNVRLKVSGPTGKVEGVAPRASSLVVAEPVRVGDRAAAALAKEAGSVTDVW